MEVHQQLGTGLVVDLNLAGFDGETIAFSRDLALNRKCKGLRYGEGLGELGLILFASTLNFCPQCRTDVGLQLRVGAIQIQMAR